MKRKDYHFADIIAALKKRGITLAELSRQSGYASLTLSNALIRTWTKGEQIIASALNMPPEKVWASCYNNRARTVRIKKRD